MPTPWRSLYSVAGPMGAQTPSPLVSAEPPLLTVSCSGHSPAGWGETSPSASTLPPAHPAPLTCIIPAPPRTPANLCLRVDFLQSLTCGPPPKTLCLLTCFFYISSAKTWVFPGGSDGKESACNAGDLYLIPGSGRSPGEGNGNPLQYSRLENSIVGILSVSLLYSTRMFCNMPGVQ